MKAGGKVLHTYLNTAFSFIWHEAGYTSLNCHEAGYTGFMKLVYLASCQMKPDAVLPMTLTVK